MGKVKSKIFKSTKNGVFKYAFVFYEDGIPVYMKSSNDVFNSEKMCFIAKSTPVIIEELTKYDIEITNCIKLLRNFRSDEKID